MPDFSALTERQREIYDFIREKIETDGYGPSIRDIGDAFDIRSPNGVMCHIKALEKKGLIQRPRSDKGRGGALARAIQLIDYHPTNTGLPMLGLVAAGSPTQAVEQGEFLEFSDLFGGKNHFVLKVKGNSMIDDHIEDGDYVVVKKQETAQNGERVVAMVENEVTLKKFYKERNRIRLEAANGDYDPIIVQPGEDVKVLGTLVGVLRKC